MQYGSSGIIKKIDALGRFPFPASIPNRWKGKKIEIMLNKKDGMIIISELSTNTSGSDVMFVRDIDTYKRIVIPSDIRKALNISAGDELEILYTNDDKYIALKPVSVSCSICHIKGKDLFTIKDEQVCEGCIEFIKSL